MVSNAVANAEGLEFYSYGNMAYNPEFTLAGRDFTDQNHVFSNEAGIGIQFEKGKFLTFIDNSIYTEMFKSKTGLWFSPKYTEYKITAGIWYGPVGLQASHQCNHIIDRFDRSRRGGYTSVSINFDTRRL